MNKKGLALLVVLTTLLFLVFLAIAVIQLISSQSRLTHHQVSRIQGYYAAQAGVNLALEHLRLNDDTVNWAATGSYTRNICNNGAAGTISCPNLPAIPVACLLTEDFPCSVLYVSVNVGVPGAGINNTRPVSATTTYTYTAATAP